MLLRNYSFKIPGTYKADLPVEATNIEFTGEIRPRENVTIQIPPLSLKLSLTVGDDAKLHVDQVSKTSEEIDVAKQSTDKARELIKSKLTEFASSTQILFRLGTETLVKTYTPDPDGITRADGFIAGKNATVLIFGTKNISQQSRDIQSAIDDPVNNLKVVSTMKIR